MARKLRLSLCGLLGALVGLGIYGALINAGIARPLFSPVTRGDLALARSDRPGLRVLFVGNSFTFENSLPALVHDLAAGDPGARPIFSVEYVAPGWTLEAAARDQGLTKLLRDVRWDDVVLQEQSQLLSFPEGQWRKETLPYARTLEERISAAGARTLLFLTWGYEVGDRHNYPGDTYAAMQERLADGYSKLGAELGAEVVPAGVAWREALALRPQLPLWADDRRHPSLVGSYLGASAFYAALTGRDPAASRFTAGIGLERARFLRRIAGIARKSAVRDGST